MDIDKPLEDLIPKRKPRSGGGGGGGADRKPRQSRDRRDAVPYGRPPPRSTEDKWVHDAYTGPERRGAGDRGERGERAPRRDAPGASAFVSASPRIEVSGLHYEVTVDDLKNIFSEAGTIVQGPTIREKWNSVQTELISRPVTCVYHLQYDRSGRSTGVAIVEYASAQQAKLALNKFDGAMTKGQTISIKLIAPPRPPPAKKEKSLMDRLGGGDLSSRIGAPRGQPAAREPREQRDRDSRGARGGRGSGKPARAPRPAKAKPATADDLDKELDGFMQPAAPAGDVAME